MKDSFKGKHGNEIWKAKSRDKEPYKNQIKNFLDKMGAE